MMTDGKFHAFLNYASAVLLGLCAIGLIVLACNCFSSKKLQTHRIILTVTPDSVYDNKHFSYYTDSLINVINKHEHVIADRYEAILEDRADTQKYWSIAGILVSIIIGIAGFFGFKTIKDIEHDCQETAKKIAAETATSVATSTSKIKTEEYLQQHLREEVQNASDVYLGNQENHIKEMVQNAVERVQNDTSEMLDDLNGRVDEISERLDALDSADTSDTAPTTSSSASGEIDLFG